MRSQATMCIWELISDRILYRPSGIGDFQVKKYSIAIVHC
ncbi:hypothetical protein GXM_00738 [Nostoc sphaeroides CCNUC1]|uniref:Uncharacterized protein n=1 Tax=Nostoc sphaeroides CCNUC1 TaxID=2653204 RepID=A0A5P8VS56_9NOSO|nr:hypothetical protein GXM_00738 [Nostoc sphaeroides CCNUC1]